MGGNFGPKYAGKEQIDGILDCAEHLLTLLAVLAVLQESWLEKEGPVNKRFRAFIREGSLHLDWGKSVALLHDGVHLTAGYDNALSLPFPDLLELANLIDDKNSPWFIAESQLREWRNNQSHLHRLPDSELEEVSVRLLEQLDEMLQSVSFLSSLPLVRIEDYELNAATGRRQATVQMIQGISPAFQRRQLEVQEEVPRGAVAFFTRSGSFIAAFPWLLTESCPTCKKFEVFAFNRYQSEVPTYVAMETGHSHNVESAAAAFAELVDVR